MHIFNQIYCGVWRLGGGSSTFLSVYKLHGKNRTALNVQYFLPLFDIFAHTQSAILQKPTHEIYFTRASSPGSLLKATLRQAEYTRQACFSSTFLPCFKDGCQVFIETNFSRQEGIEHRVRKRRSDPKSLQKELCILCFIK